MNTKLLKGLLIFSLFTIFGLYQANAQALIQYVASESMGTWSPISGTQIEGSGDDEESDLTSIGFTFPFDNRTFTTFSASTNGYVSLDRVEQSYAGAPGSGAYTSDLLAIMNSDNYVTDGNIVYEVQGSAPNRVCIVQWNGFRGYSGAIINASMQVRMYENGKIEYIYGPNISLIDRSEYIYVGAAYPTYIRVQPGNPSIMAYGTAINYDACVTTDNRGILASGKTYTFVGYPQLTEATPAKNSVLMLGQVYESPNVLHPSVAIGNYQAAIPTYVNYSISGPGNPTTPGYQTIYTATVENNLNDELVQLSGNGQYIFTNAKGIAAKTSPQNNGALDLVTNATQISGGEYTVTATLILPTVNYSQGYSHTFNIALQNDIALTEVYHPKLDKRYALGLGVCNVGCKVTNVGFNPVSTFGVTATFYKKNAGGTWDSIDFKSTTWNGGTLLTAEFTNITFEDFEFRGAGDYKVIFKANLTAATDLDLLNNVYPRAGSTEYTFAVAHAVELYADKVLAPTGTMNYTNVPILPYVTFGNKGTTDTSDVTVHMKIQKLDQGGIWRDYAGWIDVTTLVKDIPYGSYGVASFPDFTPMDEGDYKICAWLVLPTDPNRNDDTVCGTFSVVGALNGTYTIGSRYLGNAKNFPTIHDAVNSLFLKGVRGPVTFEFTDASYTEGNPLNLTDPAIDLSSKIMGVDETNVIKFKPDIDRGMNTNSININLTPGSGIGFFFGQSYAPSNPGAPVYKVRKSRIKEFANSAGYITFDGGTNKSIRFNMNTNSNLRVPMLLSNGASNITIKNCAFVDANTANPSSTCSLPLTRYATSQSRFEFETDLRSNGDGYSAAISMHSMTPIDVKTQSNYYSVDTTSNSYNKFINNTISGFSYGIVSMGVGPLIDQYAGVHKRFYNYNNLIQNNTIYNVKRAGVYFGFEENSKILNNRIFNVTGSCGADAAGIILGGESNNEYTGYNNIGIQITNNEISQVSNLNNSYGIKVEQYFCQYPLGDFLIDFPNVDDNIKITNNMIWDINVNSTAGANTTSIKNGIRVFQTNLHTEATNGAATSSIYYHPRNESYRVQNTFIANNTIKLDEANATVISGISLSSVNNTVLYNNAIAIKDASAASNSNFVIMKSCLHYQGVMPGDGALISDRNVFEVDNGVQFGAVASFLETNERSQKIDFYSDFRTDYKTIYQWQNWVSQDWNSYVGSFTTNMVLNPVENYQVYRVNLSPLPIGSFLNNHGQLLFEEVPTDIDGNVRGQGGQRFDIGACEFQGQSYQEDLSIENIIEPRNYQKGYGDYSDAEYIMQLPPYNVTALVKNNGMQSRANVPAVLVLFLEQPDGTFAPIDTMRQEIQIAPNDALNVTYVLPSDPTVQFPLTYTELIAAGYNYTVPARFVAMARNVTPRYRVKIQLLVSETNNTNNTFEKTMRFFIPKSNFGLLVSAENPGTVLTPTSTIDQIAGKLNFDSLKAGIARLGWYYESNTQYFYDVFDRNGWEPRAVNYPLYKTLYWSEGNDKPLTKLEVKDIRKFLTNGTSDNKKNLCIGSQEMIREITNPALVEYDSLFAYNVLRANSADPNSPLGANVSYHGNSVIGTNIGTTYVENISRTGYEGDAEPYPGNLKVVLYEDAVAYPAYFFRNHVANASDSTMGVGIINQVRNIVYLSVDWRHWSNSLRLHQSVLDFFIKNGEPIIPIEIVEFDATKYSNRVELNWATASELNSSKFEVEKATMLQSGKSSFTVIDEVPAQGISSVRTNYGPVVDRNVFNGETYIYRLKMIDNDGQYNYSDEVEVTYNYDSQLAITSVVPNPVTATSVVTYSVAKESNINISLYDATGKEVTRFVNANVKAGTYKFDLNSIGLSSGAYKLVITDGTQSFVSNVQIVK